MRALLLSFLLLLLAPAVQAADNPIETQIRQAVEEGRIKGLHGVLVTLGDETFAEVYFDGDDERWGRSIGAVEHGPYTLHDLRSVSKSIVGLLYGIALSEGLVPAPEEALLEAFPEYSDLPADPRRDAITIADVLTMRMGTEWNESLPNTDPRNSEIAMELAPDRYRFILDRPMVDDPGTVWTYNGGATAILARLIAKGSGKPIDVYATEKLFLPLGITEFEWVRGGDGEPSAASGLRLKLRDLAKIGRVIAKGGSYNGKQIVPPDWLEAAFEPRVTLQGLRYGYHWYLPADGGPSSWMSGFGNGGQRLTVQPKYDLVFAFFAGNYNQPDAWKVPVTLLEQILLPALKAKIGPHPNDD